MNKKSYRFHDFVLNGYSRQLFYRNEFIPISSKAFEILLCLVENYGELVEKQLLLERVWQDSFVEEGNLPVHISALRKVFKEHGVYSDVIKTISGRGYVFVAPVEETAGTEVVSAAEFGGSGNRPAIPDSETNKSSLSAEAQERYFKGQYIIETVSTRLNLEKDLYQAIEFFNQAVEIDPAFVDAYLGLSNAFYLLNVFGFIEQSSAYAKTIIPFRQAASIDPQSAGVICFKGIIEFHFELNILKAERAFLKTIELDQNNAEAHNRLGLAYLFLGDKDKSLFHYSRAGEISPQNIRYLNGLIRVHYYSGDYNSAISKAKEVLAMDSRSFPALFLMSCCYAELGIYDEALRYNDETLNVHNTLEVKFKRAYTLVLMNEPGESEKLISTVMADEKELKINFLAIAAIYSAQNRIDEAVDLLYECYANSLPDILSIKVDPRFRNLRNEERFQHLLKKLNLV